MFYQRTGRNHRTYVWIKFYFLSPHKEKPPEKCCSSGKAIHSMCGWQLLNVVCGSCFIKYKARVSEICSLLTSYGISSALESPTLAGQSQVWGACACRRDVSMWWTNGAGGAAPPQGGEEEPEYVMWQMELSLLVSSKTRLILINDNN